MTEKRLERVESHAFGPMRWLRVAAWLLLGLFAAWGFYQVGELERADAGNRRAACVSDVQVIDALITVATVEFREGDHVDSEQGAAAHRALNDEISALRVNRAVLLDSGFCAGVHLPATER